LGSVDVVCGHIDQSRPRASSPLSHITPSPSPSPIDVVNDIDIDVDRAPSPSMTMSIDRRRSRAVVDRAVVDRRSAIGDRRSRARGGSIATDGA